MGNCNSQAIQVYWYCCEGNLAHSREKVDEWGLIVGLYIISKKSVTPSPVPSLDLGEHAGAWFFFLSWRYISFQHKSGEVCSRLGTWDRDEISGFLPVIFLYPTVCLMHFIDQVHCCVVDFSIWYVFGATTHFMYSNIWWHPFFDPFGALQLVAGRHCHHGWSCSREQLDQVTHMYMLLPLLLLQSLLQHQLLLV